LVARNDEKGITTQAPKGGLGGIGELSFMLIAIKQCKNAKKNNASIYLFFYIFLFSNKIANKNVTKYIPAPVL